MWLELERRQHISTHALREEGDLPFGAQRPAKFLISTHALREEGDPYSYHSAMWPPPFLPTPSARRATANVP